MKKKSGVLNIQSGNKFYCCDENVQMIKEIVLIDLSVPRRFMKAY